eukprot:Pompholyxophrys_punicea_v1_NODE_56_length_4190_cov_12.775333.p1 type:complete len:722 gc:universal NODE_56_length_4190_cov_12.775333:938-3103(+)
MMLQYEKDMLKSVSEESSLVISAGGLNILNTVQRLASLYGNPQSLLILLNLQPQDLEYLLRAKIKNFTDVSRLTIAQRRLAYKRGGIFHGTSRVLITDFVNGNIDVEKISSIVILNVECVREDGTEAFILHIFRERNRPGLIRAFTNSPLQLSRQSLFSVSKFLNTPKIVLYPRFHKEVAASLSQLEATQVFIKQSQFIEEIALLVIDLIRSIYITKYPRSKDMEYEKILLYRQKDRDVRMFQRLAKMLFACDSLSFYTMYRCLFDEQRALGADGTWICTETSHLLLEKARCYLEDDITRGKALDHDDQATVDQYFVQEFMDEMSADEGSDVLTDENPDVSEDGSPKRVKAPGDAGVTITGHRDAYLANPKIKKLHQIIDKSQGGLTAVIVQDRIVKSAVTNIVKYLFTDRTVKVDTVIDDLCEDRYDSIILMSPDLKTIRSVEYYGTVHPGCRISILTYKNSLEEQLYLTELREEKSIFDRFIDEKVSMPMFSELDVLDIEDGSGLEYRIAVDTREMNARLPYYLYKAGNKIEISSLKLGDYVFGTRCLERKSIEDFKLSLNTGRLYSQAMRMVSSYSTPVLLLEFDNCLPTLFSFEITENFSNSLIARLCLFLVNFSQFRILWTDNPVFSVSIIRDMQRIDAANSHLAGCCGVEDPYDPTLHDILLGIPGINSFNLQKIMGSFADLHDLAFASLERLESVIGKSAGSVYRFFRDAMQND